MTWNGIQIVGCVMVLIGSFAMASRWTSDNDTVRGVMSGFVINCVIAVGGLLVGAGLR